MNRTASARVKGIFSIGIATIFLLTMPFLQYLAIASSGELYSFPGDDTGAWQNDSLIPFWRLPFPDFLGSLFHVVREPCWSISMRIFRFFVARSPDAFIRWAKANLGGTAPRPWDLKFALANTVLWLLLGGLLFRFLQYQAKRRGRSMLKVPVFIMLVAAAVTALGAIGYIEFKGPSWAGKAVGRVEASVGTLALYGESTEYPGRQAFVQSVRRNSGVALRDTPNGMPLWRLRYIQAFNSVMYTAIYKRVGRRTFNDVLDRAFADRERFLERSSPNPRLQRTPLRAPLSRKPLGDERASPGPGLECKTMTPHKSSRWGHERSPHKRPALRRSTPEPVESQGSEAYRFSRATRS